jgi:hypothetical protein
VSRTWDQNRETINDLWPLIELRPEERQLWHDDLSPLDQDVLHEALREVKRSHDSPWPQLAWIHAAYRAIVSARRPAVTALQGPPAYSTPRLVIDEFWSREWRNHREGEIFCAASLSDLDAIQGRVERSIDEVAARDAVCVMAALSARRLQLAEGLV